MDGEEVKQQNSLELLQSVYRGEEVALHVRMRAAIECLPFKNLKLSGQRLLRSMARHSPKLLSAA